MARFTIKSLSTDQKILRKRILEISFERGFSHIGSCLSAVDIIDSIYKFKRKQDKFILSNGHAGVALYAVLEKHKRIRSFKIANSLHVHPDRNASLGIDVSTGSLGQGLPIALGMALADRRKNIYCIVSDGECLEGSVWETVSIAVEKKVDNLTLFVNANGWGGYDPISFPSLVNKFKGFGTWVITINGHDEKDIISAIKKKISGKFKVIFAKTYSDQFSFLKGQDAHYHIMTNNDYIKALEQIS